MLSCDQPTEPFYSTSEGFFSMKSAAGPVHFEEKLRWQEVI